MDKRIGYLITVAITATVAVPGIAQAATKRVLMGTPPGSQKAFEKTGSEVNAFFPSNIAIRAGDFVSFVPVGFHSIDLPASGGPLALVSPTGKKVTAGDAAGMPFWFNQLDELGFDKRLVRPRFGKTLNKGSTRILSGLPLGPRLKPLRVRFGKPGLYTYFCNIHPGMRGTVRVRAKGTPVPSARGDAARVKKQAASALAVARSLVKNTKPGAATVSVSAEGKGGVHHFGMIPGKLTVRAGTAVTFRMPRNATDGHTATFGPGDALKKSSYLGAIAASFEGPAPDARGVYPSEQPGSPPAPLSSALHGNGFWNSGVMDADPRTPLPGANTVRFSTPGTYDYVCVIHPFMKGTVTVQ
ncbi:MAG: hypothetical protein WKF48_08665 [Solirubrobacteraceae bacterium]